MSDFLEDIQELLNEPSIIIDKEFEDLIPPLTADEYIMLEKSILSDGCRDPLVVWDGILVDGHNRYKICQKYNISFSTVNHTFNDRDEAKLWMMHNQLARRNLNDAQRIAIVRKCESSVKAKAEERQKATLRQNISTVRENLPTRTGRATDELGELAGVSRKTYEHATAVLDMAPEEVSQAMTEGKLSINKAYEVTQLEPEQQEEIAERLKNIKNEPEETNTPAKIINAVSKPHVAQNSGNNEWYTPADYIELANEVMDHIDLDPASSERANEVVKAKQFFTAEDSGLEHPWAGTVWMNPPYASNLISKFCDKLIGDLPDISQAIVLVNNATETEWFKKLIEQASAVCFTYGRVKFYSPDGRIAQPLQGQALLYFGSNAKKFVDVFSSKGWCAYPS